MCAPNKTCRSTSSGDQVLLKDGTKYNCSMIGWEKVFNDTIHCKTKYEY